MSIANARPPSLVSRSSSTPSPSLRAATPCLALLTALVVLAEPAVAIPTAPGYSVSEIAPDVTGDVVVVDGAVFVGIGSFGVGTQSVVRIDSSGTTTIATGFNAIAGMAYDSVNDRLILGDNGGDLSGALTGDTVYAIPSPTTASGTPASAASLELFASGSVPGVADIVLDPNDPTGATLFVSDASGSFPPAGLLLQGDTVGGTLATLETGFAFTAGLAVDGDTLFVADALLDLSGEVSTLGVGASGDPLTLLSTLPGGVFDLEFASDGSLLATSGTELVAIDPVTGAVSVVATGFGFATGLFEVAGDIYAIEGGFGLATNPLYLLTPVPEPSTATLLGFALIGLSAGRRRRLRRS